MEVLYKLPEELRRMIVKKVAVGMSEDVEETAMKVGL